MIKKIAVLIALLLLVRAPVAVASPSDDEAEGYSADSLVIKVGYFGGPYYEKAVFGVDDLWAMDVVYADYTFIDSMPSVVIDHVAGVRLSDLMKEAGIDLGSIQAFYFWTRDKTTDYYTSFAKTALIDTPRYCYYSLPDNYDHDWGEAADGADADAVEVPTLIALEESWSRVISGATFGSDYTDLNTNTRYRLIFGQTNTWEQTAARSAKWVHEIVVELGGAPTMTLDASVLDGEVGSVLRTELLVDADSAVLQHERITWESSDESVATVDELGNITIHGEGTAVITVTFAGISASVVVYGSAALAGAGGDGDGDGDEALPTPGAEGSVGQETAEESADQSTAEDELHSEEPPSPTAPETEPDDIQASPEQGNDNLVYAGDIGDAVPIGSPSTSDDDASGGVQNWRAYTLSPTVAELPVIVAENPLSGAAGAAAVMLFVLGAAGYALWFRRETRPH
ncbi:MAG: Ig-like domain-containing protein [Oscillospiraceae bacterium]|nr:Ig-like domain-containing protein [Oscillospiraceae bacterium]